MTRRLSDPSSRLLLAGFVFALFFAPAALAAQDADAILQRASRLEAGEAGERSVVFEGTLIDPTDGSERLFLLLTQGGDQLLYFLWDHEGNDLGRWSYDRGQTWFYSPSRGEVLEQSGDSNQSWRLLALILSPRRFSRLQERAIGWEMVAEDDPSNPVVRFLLEGNLDFALTVRRSDYQIVKLERLSQGEKRAILFVNPRQLDGEVQVDGMRTLRDGTPHRLYRFHQVTYGKPLEAAMFSAESFFELPFSPPLPAAAPAGGPEESGSR